MALGYADLQIDVVTVDKKFTDLLNIGHNQPVNRIRRLTHDINGVPIDFEYIYSPLDMMRFSVRVARW